MSCEQALNMMGPSGYRKAREPYVDFDVLRSWVRRQCSDCMNGANETHLSMMFRELDHYLECVEQNRRALRFGGE